MTVRKQIEQPQEVTDPLHIRYRPRHLDDVLGQDPVVKSLRAVLKEKSRPHAFLFTGPAGTGKTTLARILTTSFECDSNNVIEVDAASNSGIDAMREITSTLRYNGFGDTPNKAIIIDEAHGLSKQAWDSLLKSVEQPPPHVFFFFCTTVPSKVPETIVTRCHSYNLKQVRFNELMDLLERVCDAEQFDSIPTKHLEMVARAADGSPRKALVQLSMIHDAEDEDEVAVLLESPLENKEVIELCRLMVQEKLTWEKVQFNLKALGDVPAESIRIVISCYLAACLMGSKSGRDQVRLLDMLECFNKPCNPSDKLAPLLIAFGRLVFQD